MTVLVFDSSYSRHADVTEYMQTNTYRVFHGGEEIWILCLSGNNDISRYRCCHENIKSIFPRHREMFCLLYGLIYSDTITHNDDKT